MDNWVDFKAVKAAVTIRMVLDHYGVNWLRKKGSELHGRCPIHKGQGQDSFHVSVEKNCFQCFAGSCGKRGNVLDFVAAMEKCTVRDAALKLKQWFAASTGADDAPDTAPGSQLAREKEVGERGESNKPLTFQLKGVDSSHSYLGERGITQKTAEEFGVGFFFRQGQYVRARRHFHSQRTGRARGVRRSRDRWQRTKI